MRKYFTLFLIMLLLVGFSMLGCTKYAKEEQLKQLDETEAAALAAEKKLKGKEAEKRGWENKLAQKEAERDAKKAEKDAIEENLGKQK